MLVGRFRIASLLRLSRSLVDRNAYGVCHISEFAAKAAHQLRRQLADIHSFGDQEFAGALMWVWVTFAYLSPAAVITIQLLSPRRSVLGIDKSTEHAHPTLDPRLLRANNTRTREWASRD